jgi:hypothetical protein
MMAFAWLAAVTLLAGACGSSVEEESVTVDGTQEANAEAGSSTEADGSTDDEATEPDEPAEGGDGVDTGELFPDVVGATAQLAADGTWTFSATLSSPYDTPERYADGWRVVGPDGTVYGERPLTHDHQSEQPFTRSQSGIEIPADVVEVTVEGRDQVSGWGGATVQVTLER